jgi:hypothetical protein
MGAPDDNLYPGEDVYPSEKLYPGMAVRLLREANLNERQLRSMLVYVNVDVAGVGAGTSLALDPKTEAVVADFARRFGPRGRRMLAWAIPVVLTVGFGIRSDQRAERAERLTERIEHEEADRERERDARERSTGALTAQDEEAIAKAVAEAIAADRAAQARKQERKK